MQNPCFPVLLVVRLFELLIYLASIQQISAHQFSVAFAHQKAKGVLKSIGGAGNKTINVKKSSNTGRDETKQRKKRPQKRFKEIFVFFRACKDRLNILVRSNG